MNNAEAQRAGVIKRNTLMGTKKNKKKKKEVAGGDAQAQPSPTPPHVPAASNTVEDDALREIAHSEKRKGNEEYLKKRYSTAVTHYTRGIAASSREPALLVLLLVNRAISYLRIKVFICSISFFSSLINILALRNINLLWKIVRMQFL